MRKAMHVIDTEQSKYSDVLKAIRSVAKLVDLGADMRSINRTRMGEMILEFKRDKERKGATYKSLSEGTLGERVEVSAPTQEATLKVKDLIEVTEVEDGTALRHRTPATVRGAGGRRRHKATEGGDRDTDSFDSATCGGRKKLSLD